MGRRFVFGLALIVFGFALAWGMGEVAFRVVPNRYESLVRPGNEGSGAWHRPNAQFRWIGQTLRRQHLPPNEVTWNSRGWHDVEHAVAKPAGVTRVIVIGDSFVESVQVPLAATFYRKLEALLAAELHRPVEVIAIGWSGWGQEQELAALTNEGLSYSPDLVIVEFCGWNDVRNNNADLEALATRYYADSTLRRCFAKAETYNLLFAAFLCDRGAELLKRARLINDSPDFDVFRERPEQRPDLWARAWETTAQDVAAMSQLASSVGARFALVGFSTELELADWAGTPERPDLNGRLPAERISAISDREGFPWLNLASRFATLPAEIRSQLHIADDGHWSVVGHEYAARYIAEQAATLLDGGVIEPRGHSSLTPPS